MRKILSTHDLRVLHIVEYLHLHEQPSVSEICRFFNITSKTLRTDINFINEYCMPLHITTHNFDGIFLDIPQNYTVEYLYETILSNSTEFKIIETVFFDETHTVDSLAEKLYLSTSTVRRLIKRINKALVSEDFSISLTPLKIVGNETNICNFIIYYISEKYTGRKKPFSRIQLNVLDKMFISATKSNGHTVNFPQIEKLRIWIMVIIIRLQNGNHTDVYTPFSEDVDLSALENPLFKNLFKLTFKVELTDEVIFRLFYPFINENFAVNQQTLTSMVQKKPEVAEKVTALRTLLDNIALKMNIPQPNQNEVLLNLYNISIFQYGKPYILYNRYQYFVDSIEKDYPEFIAVFKEELSKSNLGELETHTINSFAYTIFTNWQNLMLELEKLAPKMSVGLFFNTDVEHMRMLKDKITYLFNNNLESTIIMDLSLKSFTKHAQKYDIVLTNITGLHVNNVPVFCVPVFPTTKDWVVIHNYYEKNIKTSPK